MFIENINNKKTNNEISKVLRNNDKFPIVGLDENGNIPLISDTLEAPREKKIKEIIAVEKGLEKTGNSNIYYDKTKDVYFVWDENKQKFVKNKTINKVYPRGYYQVQEKNTSPKIFDLQNNDLGLKSKEVMEIVFGLEELDSNWIAKNWGFYYNLRYCPEENKYYDWDDKIKEFVPSEITDIAGDRYFAKNGKYYYAGYGHEEDIEISVEEFYLKKLRM